MLDLTKLQQDLDLWLNHNFPNTTSDKQLIGVMEELGELCHADLKQDQGIRGYNDPKITEVEIKDAVGDIVIYLVNYCNKKGISFEECVSLAATTVIKRDWIQNPLTGKAKELPIIPLICSICGKPTKGRQRPNTTKGQGICPKCYDWLKTTCDDQEHLQENYGDKGYHFYI